MRLKLKTKFKIRIRKAAVRKAVKITLLSGIFAVLTATWLTLNQVSQSAQRYQRENETAREVLLQVKKELNKLKEEDQYQVNQALNSKIKIIEETYRTAVASYEDLLKLKESTKKTEELDNLFTRSLTQLANQDYNSASESLANLDKKIKEEKEKMAEAAAKTFPPQNVPQNNTPPGAGYSRQRVSTDAGTFLVSVIATDIGSTRVVVDTASSGDCGNECPVLPLASYVSRNGAFAGVNGSYFCPATYPSCAGKTNSFDLLVMNKNKTYFNSGNNVYSNNPAVIFGENYVRFVSAASQWGRDTSPNGVLSNYPLLVFNNNITFGGDDDPKKGNKGNRSFVANKGNTVYIGVVHNATVAESARAMKAMGMENALNLDDGGSTALWSGGYRVGPGRDLPNVILFVKK